MTKKETLQKLLPATDNWPLNEQQDFTSLVSFVVNADFEIAELKNQVKYLKSSHVPDAEIQKRFTIEEMVGAFRSGQVYGAIGSPGDSPKEGVFMSIYFQRFYGVEVDGVSPAHFFDQRDEK
jgi:hypothetical protein